MVFKRRHNISQGSVATSLRCGGIFDDDFIADLLLSVPANSENRSICDKVVNFYGPLCTLPIKNTTVNLNINQRINC